MSRYRVGVVCKWLAAIVAISGMIPVAVLLNPWQRRYSANPLYETELEEIHFQTILLKAVVIALVGLAGAYVLFRVGSHLKSKRGGWRLRRKVSLLW